MSSYIDVPIERLADTVLQNLLEEFASRDCIDYGEVELTLEQKTGNLRRLLGSGELLLVFETESEQWDLVDAQQARSLINQVDNVD